MGIINLILWILRGIRDFAFWVMRSIKNMFSSIGNMIVSLWNFAISGLQTFFLVLTTIVSKLIEFWGIYSQFRESRVQQQTEIAQSIYRALEEKDRGNDNKCEEIVHITTIKYGRRRVGKIIDSILREEGMDASIRNSIL